MGIDRLPDQIGEPKGIRASLRTQWQACTASAKPISMVIIDVDHFKLFNDKYGHIQGGTIACRG
ncbi:diguanylate cyclase [Shewanella benthica]|uniref:Sensory box/GGDEF family protein n=1 Tax=Shewanella benthica KT99 TaxID=314608 RepID=A9CVU7_9GAMM|nr:diguanylate cyclase [Shewanella benthica]EDQ02737.1 sensory box/GGDEF family protein [Shewanella benthica KT99]